MMKQKYNVKQQELPRHTMLIKGFNTDIKDKAPIFDDTLIKAFMLGKMESTYWLVKQAISQEPAHGQEHAWEGPP